MRHPARVACGAVFAAVCACADPSADVLVTWVDAIDDGHGIRKLQVYDRGQRYDLAIEPVVPGSGTEQLRLGVDSRGSGIALSGELSTRYVSLRTNRQPRLTRDAAGGQTLAESFNLTRNGDAVLRGFDSDSTGTVALMPTTSDHAGRVTVLEPPPSAGTMRLLSASDAPVLFWVTLVSSAGPPAPYHLEGLVQAMLYPSEHGGVLPPVEDVTVLATGNVVGVGDEDGSLDQQRVDESWCPGRTCVSPDGRSLVVRGTAPCTFEWWRWEDADPANPDQVLQPRTVVIDDICPDLVKSWSMFAQLEFDTVVLDDDDRFYVVDLNTAEVVPGPKLWDDAGERRHADRGRAILLVSADNQVTRIDSSGIRLMSTEAHPCPRQGSPIRVSPSGYWVVRSCNGDGVFLPADAGTTLRISPLGLEPFAGIPMRPLAIDDEGNAIMYSFDNDEDPRGLFVLTSDGQLSRVDSLEPQPARVLTEGDVASATMTTEANFFGFAELRP